MATDLIGEAKGLFTGGEQATAQASSGGGDLLIWIVVIGIIFIGLFGFLTYWYIMRKQFKYKVIIYRRINGKFQEAEQDRGKRERYGTAGDQIMYLLKNKKLLPFPTIQSGFNIYRFFVSDDEEWINFDFDDFDVLRRKVGAQFLDKEMRFARTSLQVMGDERYKKIGFWEKYGGLIAYVVLILVTCIGLWLIVDKMTDVSNASATAVQSAERVLQESARILGAVDNVKNGGSGLVPAT